MAKIDDDSWPYLNIESAEACRDLCVDEPLCEGFWYYGDLDTKVDARRHCYLSQLASSVNTNPDDDVYRDLYTGICTTNNHSTKICYLETPSSLDETSGNTAKIDGHSWPHFDIESAEACRDLCEDEPLCVGFWYYGDADTYVDARRHCYLSQLATSLNTNPDNDEVYRDRYEGICTTREITWTISGYGESCDTACGLSSLNCYEAGLHTILSQETFISASNTLGTQSLCTTWKEMDNSDTTPSFDGTNCYWDNTGTGTCTGQSAGMGRLCACGCSCICDTGWTGDSCNEQTNECPMADFLNPNTGKIQLAGIIGEEVSNGYIFGWIDGDTRKMVLTDFDGETLQGGYTMNSFSDWIDSDTWTMDSSYSIANFLPCGTICGKSGINSGTELFPPVQTGSSCKCAAACANYPDRGCDAWTYSESKFMDDIGTYVDCQLYSSRDDINSECEGCGVVCNGECLSGSRRAGIDFD